MNPRFLFRCLSGAFAIFTVVELAFHGTTNTAWLCLCGTLSAFGAGYLVRGKPEPEDQYLFMTIRMSGREPVQILVRDWPVLVQAGEEGSDRYLVVRTHADNRALVYGSRGAAGVVFSAGVLLKDPHMSTLLKTIQEVASSVNAPSLGEECLAKLKPEIL